MKRFAPAAAVAILVAIAAAVYLLREPEVVDPGRSFDFAVYGDSRYYRKVHERICRVILMTSPKYAIHTGDLVNSGDRDDEWEIHREVTRDLRARMPLYIVKGNHDIGSKGHFEKELGRPKTYYEERIGDIHYFFLDSGDAKLPDEQLAWFESAASASQAPHRVAVLHHPSFTMFESASRNEEAARVRGRLHPLVVKHRMCAVFAGHKHAFHLAVRDGVSYVTTGGGGSNRHKLNPSLAQKGDLWKESSYYHFVGCTVDAKRITGQVVGQYGEVRPELSFTICEHR
jgi:predicted phosphodiesterase